MGRGPNRHLPHRERLANVEFSHFIRTDAAQTIECTSFGTTRRAPATHPVRTGLQGPGHHLDRGSLSPGQRAHRAALGDAPGSSGGRAAPGRHSAPSGGQRLPAGPGFRRGYNARFALPADDPGQAYRQLDPALDLDRSLSFRYTRVVQNDNTVRLEGQLFQIPPGAKRRSHAKAHVWVHEFLKGSFGVWYQAQWLLRTPPPEQSKPLRARTRHRERPEMATPTNKPPPTQQPQKTSGPRWPAPPILGDNPSKGSYQQALPSTESLTSQETPLTKSRSSWRPSYRQIRWATTTFAWPLDTHRMVHHHAR